MRRFYLVYGERIPETASRKLFSSTKSQALSDFLQKSETLSRKSSVTEKNSDKTQAFTLSWSHYVFLVGIKNIDERSFYEIEATEQNWSLRELKRQYQAGLYERLALSRDKDGVRKLAKEGQVVANPDDLLKEPYVLRKNSGENCWTGPLNRRTGREDPLATRAGGAVSQARPDHPCLRRATQGREVRLMRYAPEKHHRRSIRLKGYDYSQLGAYFVTICTQDRECLFGEIVEGEMRLNTAGRMIEKWFWELENKFQDICCDEHIVMPNHFHCIIINVGAVGADLRVCPDDGQSRDGQSRRIAPTEMGEHNRGEHIGSPLPVVVQWFKTMTTNEYIRGVKQSGWARFDGRLWQRNYYEHIIRNDESLHRIREYIINNPLQWDLDRENPIVGAGLKPAPTGDEPWHI